jgi:imidazolonepropionase-like amidohydrolase
MKRHYGHSQIPVLAIALLILLHLPLISQVKAVKAKKIYTVTQGVIENGVLLIEDGKIIALGQDVKIPWNAEVLDYGGKFVIPGLIEVHAARGYDLANETNPLTPFVTVLDNVDLTHEAFKTALRSGVTLMNVMPGNATILGGRGAVLKTSGWIIGDALMVPDSGMKISVSGTAIQSRMGVMAQLRRYFDETKDYLEKKEKAEAAPKEAAPQKEEMVSTPMAFRSPESVKYEAVADLLKGRYSAFIYCQSPSDVIRAQKLSEAYGLSSVYILGPECYKAADFIAGNKLKVVLDPDVVHFEKDPVTEKLKKVDAAAIFQAKGVEFALQSDPNNVSARDLLYQAMKLRGRGIPDETILKSVTLVPARFLGIDGQAGSLDKGKLANFAVLDKEPLDPSGKIEFVYIEGKPVYDRSIDEDLKDLADEKIDR